MNKYFEVTAIFDGVKEVLFGSFERSDCKYEVEAEKDSWKSDGYKKIKIESREVEETLDEVVYEDAIITKHELFREYAPSFNFELNEDQLVVEALERGFITNTGITDKYLINRDY